LGQPLPKKPKQFYVGNVAADNPVAAALGRYFAEFASLEFARLVILSRILGHGDKHEISGAIFKRIRSISDRIQLLLEVAEAAELQKNQLAAIEAMCEHFRNVNARRNMYAHSVYECTDEGEVRLTAYILSAGRKKKVETLTAKKIDKDINDVQAAILMAQIWVGKIPLSSITVEPLECHSSGS
jgi:hypothetical protein